MRDLLVTMRTTLVTPDKLLIARWPFIIINAFGGLCLCAENSTLEGK